MGVKLPTACEGMVGCMIPYGALYVG